MAQSENGQATPDFPIREIQEELARLIAERQRLVERRDHLYHTVIEAGDDTGFALTKIMKQLKQIEQRIEQWKDLLKAKGLAG